MFFFTHYIFIRFKIKIVKIEKVILNIFYNNNDTISNETMANDYDAQTEQVKFTGKIENNGNKKLLEKTTYIISTYYDTCKFVRTIIHNDYHVVEYYNMQFDYRLFLIFENNNFIPENLMITVTETIELIDTMTTYNNYKNRGISKCIKSFNGFVTTKKQVGFDSITHGFFVLKYNKFGTDNYNRIHKYDNNDYIMFSRNITDKHYLKIVDITDLKNVCNYTKLQNLYFMESKTNL